MRKELRKEWKEARSKWKNIKKRMNENKKKKEERKKKKKEQKLMKELAFSGNPKQAVLCWKCNPVWTGEMWREESAKPGSSLIH